MDSDGLRVQITDFDGRPIVAVQGEVDLTTAPEFAEVLRTVTTLDAPEVLVDLSGVTFMDSTGLGVLVMAARKVTVRIVGSSPAIGRILELAGLDEMAEAGGATFAGDGLGARQGEFAPL
jgi:anti-sigma B factor antagonist